MKLAVTYENGLVFQHFGKSEQFLCVDVEEGRIINKSMLSCDGQGHGALAGLLKQAGVEVLICGGLGAGAHNALVDKGITVIRGAKGNAEMAVEAYLKGTLHDDPNGSCHHLEGHYSCEDHAHCHHDVSTRAK